MSVFVKGGISVVLNSCDSAESERDILVALNVVWSTCTGVLDLAACINVCCDRMVSMNDEREHSSVVCNSDMPKVWPVKMKHGLSSGYYEHSAPKEGPPYH